SSISLSDSYFKITRCSDDSGRAFTDGTTKVVTTNLAVISLIFALSIGPVTYRAITAAAPNQMRYLNAAEEMRKLGVMPGDKIGSLEYSNRFNSEWARLAKVRIVAEIFSPEDVDLYWTADERTKQRVIEAFERTGSVLVVAGKLPSAMTIAEVEQAGWRPLGKTGAFVYPLRTGSNNSLGREK